MEPAGTFKRSWVLQKRPQETQEIPSDREVLKGKYFIDVLLLFPSHMLLDPFGDGYQISWPLICTSPATPLKTGKSYQLPVSSSWEISRAAAKLLCSTAALGLSSKNMPNPIFEPVSGLHNILQQWILNSVYTLYIKAFHLCYSKYATWHLQWKHSTCHVMRKQ